MKKSFVVLFLALICSSCALFYRPTEGAYNRSVASWVGRGTADLYAEWGYPQSSHLISENTYYETFYKETEGSFLRFSNDRIDNHRKFLDKWETKVSSFNTDEMPKDYNCRTSFIIVNGIIVDYSYEGSGCVD